MEAFKRGFVQKCAEYGFDKEAAKELFKKMKKNLAAHEAGESAAKEMKEEACAKTAADVTPAPGIMELLKTYAPELIGGGVGAGLGAGAGAW
jgi:beta-phosphoglucomutase-like phosphatase (HAD superfamily)